MNKQLNPETAEDKEEALTKENRNKKRIE